jgi:hypothetical protein
MSDGETVSTSPAPIPRGAAPPAAVPGTPAPESVATCESCGQTVASESARPLPGNVRSGTWRGPVYAVGRVTPQFPSIAVEKEFVQLTGQVGHGMVETELLREVLRAPDNRYLARHLCWVFATQEVDTFALAPREEAELARLVDLLPDDAAEDVVHVVVGSSVLPGAIYEPCPTLGLPTVVADQLFGFTLDEFGDALQNAEAAESAASAPAEASSRKTGRAARPRDQLQAVVRDVFSRLTRRAENRGVSDEHRALNYLALRYPPLYHAVAQAYDEGKLLVDIHARHRHSSDRRLVSVEVIFRHRRTEITDRLQCLVDVTEVFPFLVTKLQPTFE